MSIYYVNSQTGNNANSGATPALAKATIASLSPASGDTVFLSGIFAPFIAVAGVNYRGYGFCAVDGGGGAGMGSVPACSFRDLIFRNCGTQAIEFAGAARFYRCQFLYNAYALYDTNTEQGCIFEECLFYGNTVAAIYGYGNQPSRGILRNCVFAGNPKSIYLVSPYSSYPWRAQHCVFRDPIMWDIDVPGGVGAESDWNVYDFTHGKCVVGGVDKTSLAAWKAALTSPRDLNSIDNATAALGDPANGALRTTPAGDLLTLGPGGFPVGLSQPAVTISNNRNSSLWTGGIFSNTGLDGSGYVVLSPGQTSGYWRSGVIDFGAALPAQRLELALAGESYPTAYADYDTADNPGYLTVRVRGSNVLFAAADASPSWVTIPRCAEIGAYMSNSLRYWQVEVTLRQP